MAWDSRPLSGGRCVEPLAWGPERGRKGAASIALSAPHVRGAPGAKSFVDDLILGQGFVSSRAATSLRSIESHPLSQAFVSPSGAAWAPAHDLLHHTQGWVPLPLGQREGCGGGSAGLREAASSTCPLRHGGLPLPSLPHRGAGMGATPSLAGRQGDQMAWAWAWCSQASRAGRRAAATQRKEPPERQASGHLATLAGLLGRRGRAPF